jgi:outer membrane protein
MLRTQEKAANLPDAPQIQDQMQKENPGSSLDTPAGAAGEPLTRQQAEQLALKNNPRVSVTALLALAQKQVVRETRSALLPALNGNLTGVDAAEGSRISAGSLTASRLLYHAGAGLDLSQLITDFGHTNNLVASSKLQAKAAEQNAQATREDIVLAADLAFYNALEAQATLEIAKSTVNARQAVSDQVDSLTANNLKSTLDQSFAQVNLCLTLIHRINSMPRWPISTMCSGPLAIAAIIFLTIHLCLRRRRQRPTRLLHSPCNSVQTYLR